MKKYKTDNLSINISVGGSRSGQNKIIEIAMTDNERMPADADFEIRVPSALCKSTVNDDSLAKHIINFFIKG